MQFFSQSHLDPYSTCLNFFPLVILLCIVFTLCTIDNLIPYFNSADLTKSIFTYTSDLDQLKAAAPDLSTEYIAAVYELSNMNFAATFTCIHDHHGTLNAVLELMKDMMKFDSGNVPKIYVNNTIKDYVDSALEFYKSPNLNVNKGVCIEMMDAPGIDVGGVRRDFFHACITNWLVAT